MNRKSRKLLAFVFSSMLLFSTVSVFSTEIVAKKREYLAKFKGERFDMSVCRGVNDKILTTFIFTENDKVSSGKGRYVLFKAQDEAMALFEVLKEKYIVGGRTECLKYVKDIDEKYGYMSACAVRVDTKEIPYYKRIVRDK